MMGKKLHALLLQEKSKDLLLLGIVVELRLGIPHRQVA